MVEELDESGEFLASMKRSVAELQERIRNRPEEYVRQWTDKTCDNSSKHINCYEVPLFLLVNFLQKSCDDDDNTEKKAQIDLNCPLPAKFEEIIIDIVSRSPLQKILEHDANENSIRYRSTVPQSVRHELGMYSYSLSDGIADYYEDRPVPYGKNT